MWNGIKLRWRRRSINEPINEERIEKRLIHGQCDHSIWILQTYEMYINAWILCHKATTLFTNWTQIEIQIYSYVRGSMCMNVTVIKLAQNELIKQLFILVFNHLDIHIFRIIIPIFYFSYWSRLVDFADALKICTQKRCSTKCRQIYTGKEMLKMWIKKKKYDERENVRFVPSQAQARGVSFPSKRRDDTCEKRRPIWILKIRNILNLARNVVIISTIGFANFHSSQRLCGLQGMCLSTQTCFIIPDAHVFSLTMHI